MVRKELAQSGGMSDEGKRITTRRERLKLNKSDLAREAGVHRDTVTDLEAGKGFQAATLAKVDEALARLEEEAGLTATPRQSNPAVVEFEVSGDFGVRVVVRGPISDAEALERSVERLVRNIRAEQTDDDRPGE